MYEDDNIIEEEEKDFDPTKTDPDEDEDSILKEPDDSETTDWEEK